MLKELPGNGDLLNPGERWATPMEAEEFWTEERLSTAQRVYESMNWRLMEEFGGPEALPFSQKAFLLKVTEDRDKATSSGAHHISSGWIMLNISEVTDDRWLAQVIAHEVGESRAQRFSQSRQEYTFIDEAVIETTMQRFLYDEWPQLKDDPDPVAYSLACNTTTSMCKQIFHALPEQFAYPHHVFELLQRAIFENQHGDFFSAFTSAYGRHGLIMLESLGYFGRRVANRNLVDVESGNAERYKWLLRFLQGEEIDLWKADEAIETTIRKAEERRLLSEQRIKQRSIEYEQTHAPKEVIKDGDRVIQERFTVNGSIIEVDYTQIPEDVPIDDIPHEESYHKWGVRTRVGQAIDYIYLRLKGESAHRVPLTIGKLPKAIGTYNPTESDIVTRQVSNAAHDLLTVALDVQEQPSYEFLHAKRRDKVEFHEGTHLGELENGKRVYFLYIYKTRKVRKKDEWNVLRDKALAHIMTMKPEQVEKWVAEKRLWY